jgi:hypothetical protein
VTVIEITPKKKTGVTLNYATGSLVELTVIGSKKRPKGADYLTISAPPGIQKKI